MNIWILIWPKCKSPQQTPEAEAPENPSLSDETAGNAPSEKAVQPTGKGDYHEQVRQKMDAGRHRLPCRFFSCVRRRKTRCRPHFIAAALRRPIRRLKHIANTLSAGFPIQTIRTPIGRFATFRSQRQPGETLVFKYKQQNCQDPNNRFTIQFADNTDNRGETLFLLRPQPPCRQAILNRRLPEDQSASGEYEHRRLSPNDETDILRFSRAVFRRRLPFRRPTQHPAARLCRLSLQPPGTKAYAISGHLHCKQEHFGQNPTCSDEHRPYRYPFQTLVDRPSARQHHPHRLAHQPVKDRQHQPPLPTRDNCLPN